MSTKYKRILSLVITMFMLNNGASALKIDREVSNKNTTGVFKVLGTEDNERLSLADFKEKYNLVELNGLEKLGIFVDLKYATNDNFTGQVIYDDSICLIREEVYNQLIKVAKNLGKSGYGLKIWDALRTLEAQQNLWDVYPDPNYVTPPTKGSNHNRGNTVDITLVKIDDTNELGYVDVEMPTGFDDFSSKAHLDATNISKEAKKNRKILQEAMKEADFKPYSKEWWHFVYSREYDFIKESYEPLHDKML